MDRTPHDMPNTCDICSEARRVALLRACMRPPDVAAAHAQYCIRGRWHCGACEDYDVCRKCVKTLGAPGATWPHQHAPGIFELQDAPPPGEDDSDDEAPAAAAADAGGDAVMAEGDATARDLTAALAEA